MDLGLAAPVVNKKVKHNNNTEMATHDAILGAMAKLCLSNALAIRQLRAISMDTYKVPTDMELVAVNKTMIKNYTTKAAEFSDQDQKEAVLG